MVQLTNRNFLQVIPSQVEGLQAGQVTDLDRQVCNLVAGGILEKTRRDQWLML